VDIKLQKPSSKLILPAISVLVMIVSALIVVLDHQGGSPLHKILVAKSDIATGQTLDASNTKIETIPFDPGGYLPKLTKGIKATQTILKGQLIPSQSVASSEHARTPIRFNGLETISDQLSVGDHVDVWATPNDRQSGGGAEVVAFDAIVTKVVNTSNMALNQTSVEVRIPTDYLVSVLEAKANSLAIELVLSETLADQ
jgi:Flp pilus assembly protein CpaB